MTSQKAQIQKLINEIDGVLSKTTPRLPWVMSGDVEHQRRVLEETRQYLTSLEQQVASAEQYGGLPALPGTYAPQSGGYPATPSADSAQQVLQAVLQEMSYLRSHVMQPLRSDIDEMQQKREALAQEIRLLEAQRQQYLLSQSQPNQQQVISEFLQSLMGRLQENLTGQVAQMLSNMEAQMASDRAALGADPYSSGNPNALPAGMPPYQPMLTPAQRLEHLQMMQAQSDQLLLKLDSTLRVIFDSLQSNVQTYQESLGQGIDKMHNLGQQGEAMFAALINRLAQLLGREASTYLQSSMDGVQVPQPQQNIWDASHSLPGLDTTSPNALSTPPFPTDTPDLPDLSNLDLPDLDLSNVNLEPSPTSFDDGGQDDDLTIFQVDEAAALARANARDDDDDLTFFQMPEEVTTHIQDDEELSSNELDGLDEGSNEDLEALDLLNQLTTIQVDEDVLQDARTTPELEDDSPEALYGELNDLYESMFGITGGGPAVEEDGEPPVDQHIADASQRPNEESVGEPVTVLEAEEPVTMFQVNEEEPVTRFQIETEEQEEQEEQTDLASVEADDFLEQSGLVSDLADLALAPEALEDYFLDDLDEVLAEEEAGVDLEPTASAMADSIESLLFSESDSLEDADTDQEPDPDIEENWFLTTEPQAEDGIGLGRYPAPEQSEESTPDIVESLADLVAIAEAESAASEEVSGLADMLHYSDTGMGHDDEDGEAYIPAAPEESLVDMESEGAPEPSSQTDFRLTADTLQQLTTDLSNLEGLDEEDLFSASEMLAMEDDNLLVARTTLQAEVASEVASEVAEDLASSSESSVGPEGVPEVASNTTPEVETPPAPQSEVLYPLEEDIPDLAELLAEADLPPAVVPVDEQPEISSGMESSLEDVGMNLDDFFGEDTGASPEDVVSSPTAEPSWSVPPEDELSLDSFMADEAVPLDESVNLPEADMLSEMAEAAPTEKGESEHLSLDDFDVATDTPMSSLPLDMSGATNLEDLFGDAYAEEEETTVDVDLSSLEEDRAATTQPPSGTSSVQPSSPALDTEMRTADGVSLEELFAGDEFAGDLSRETASGQAPGSGLYAAEVNEPEDLFGGMGEIASEESDTSETISAFTQPTSGYEYATDPTGPSNAGTSTQGNAANAFTLEGLDQLFEDVPDTTPEAKPIAPPSTPASTDGSAGMSAGTAAASSTDDESFTVEDVFSALFGTGEASAEGPYQSPGTTQDDSEKKRP